MGLVGDEGLARRAFAITGSVGGVLRDILSAEVRLLLRHSEPYATAWIAGVAVYLIAERAVSGSLPPRSSAWPSWRRFASPPFSGGFACWRLR
jgi:hypothetical protein